MSSGHGRAHGDGRGSSDGSWRDPLRRLAALGGRLRPGKTGLMLPTPRKTSMETSAVVLPRASSPSSAPRCRCLIGCAPAPPGGRGARVTPRCFRQWSVSSRVSLSEPTKVWSLCCDSDGRTYARTGRVPSGHRSTHRLRVQFEHGTEVSLPPADD